MGLQVSLDPQDQGFRVRVCVCVCVCSCGILVQTMGALTANTSGTLSTENLERQNTVKPHVLDSHGTLLLVRFKLVSFLLRHVFLHSPHKHDHHQST
jgi:hypothetical protein